MPERFRPAWVEVDEAAIAQNTRLLGAIAAPARLCAVVKADGYGHGAARVASAALAGGAERLAVALVEEAVALREAGIGAPILLLSEPPLEALGEAVARKVAVTCYRREAIHALARAAKAQGVLAEVQLKVDTGMHRVGADADAMTDLAEEIRAAPVLRLGGLWTHFAVADDPEDPFTDLQLARLKAASAMVRRAGIVPLSLHAANSAGTIAHPDARLDLVRCGIALYGHLPSEALAPRFRLEMERLERTLAHEPSMDDAPASFGLVPALSLKAQVHLVRDLPAGESTSYGRAYRLEAPARVAVLPLGYHDGVPRRLFETGAAVLIKGRRRPIAGAVTMDQLLVDCGGDGDVEVGDEAVLLGRQGAEEITAEEWARRLGTIAYEVLCGIGARVPRVGVACGDSIERWPRSRSWRAKPGPASPARSPHLGPTSSSASEAQAPR